MWKASDAYGLVVFKKKKKTENDGVIKNKHRYVGNAALQIR